MDEIILFMYEELKTRLLNDKKLYRESVLLSFFNIKSNTRLKYLLDTAYSSMAFKGQKDLYTSRKLIKFSGIEDRYCITAKSIWEIESNILMEDDLMLDFIDEKYFYCPSEENDISEKERIILFSMVLGRVFSSYTQMDLKIEESHLSRWEEIILLAYDLLNEVGCITKLDKSDIFGKKGNEHAVSNLIRHTDSLPKKSNMLFKATGKQKYYLELCKEGESEIDKEKFKYLIGLIFNKATRLSLKETDYLANKCINIAHEIGIYTNNVINPFISLNIDNLIKESFEEI